MGGIGMSSKKYIAAVMEKSSLADEYIYIFNHVIFGEYDKERKVFTDEYGKKYNYMMSKDATTKDEAVYHILELDKLSEILEKDEKTYKDLVLEYTNQIKEIVYFVGFTEDKTPFLSSINVGAIRREANEIHEKGAPWRSLSHSC